MSLFIAALAGIVMGALVLDNVQWHTVVKWGVASSGGYFSVFAMERICAFFNPRIE